VLSRYLIDKQGEILPAFDEGLVEKFGYPLPDFDLPSYAVRNLGAVDVEIRAEHTDVRFRWLTVSAAALEAVARLLLQPAVTRVTIYCESHQWMEYHFETGAQAAGWIEANGEQGRATSTRNILTTARQLQSLSDRSLSRIEDSDDRLALIFKKWRLTHGRFNPDMVSFLLRFGLLDRTVVAAEAAESRELVFEHSGAAFTLYDSCDKAWNLRAQGARVSDQPDTEYGRWIERTYRSVLDRNEPRFESVDAVVQGRTAEPYRFCYDRLVLPWHDERGARLITGTSYTQRSERIGAG
jgi:hypothetical protein